MTDIFQIALRNQFITANAPKYEQLTTNYKTVSTFIYLLLCTVCNDYRLKK